MTVELVIRLPAVDEPRLDLQMVGGEPLDSHAVEEPWRVGRNIGRLIGPVIEVVITEQADVGDEDTGVDVESVMHVEVVSAVGFRNVFVSGADIPLADRGAGVVAYRGGGKHSEEPAPCRACCPRENRRRWTGPLLDLAAPEDFAGSAHGVIFRLIEINAVERVRAELSAEVFRIEGGSCWRELPFSQVQS